MYGRLLPLIVNNAFEKGTETASSLTCKRICNANISISTASKGERSDPWIHGSLDQIQYCLALHMTEDSD